MEKKAPLIFALSVGLMTIMLFSCKKSIYKSYENKGNLVFKDSVQLCHSGNKSFPLDEITSHLITSAEFNESLNTFSFISKNRLYLYDYSSSNLIKKIAFKSISPNNFLINSLDTIFLFDYGKSSICLVDTLGTVLERYKIEEKEEPFFPFTITKTSDVCFFDNKLTFFGHRAGEGGYDKRHVMGQLDLNTRKYSFYVPYPEIYKKNWGGALFRWVYAAYNPIKKLFIVSFPAEHSLFSVDPISKQIEIIESGSKHIQSTYYLNSSIKKNNSNLAIQHFVETDSYGRLLYDKYQDVYYRVIEKGTEFTQMIGWQKPIFITILNNKFEILGETYIGACNLNYRYTMFVSKEGLHIPKRTTEDVLVFDIYQLKKL